MKRMIGFGLGVVLLLMSHLAWAQLKSITQPLQTAQTGNADGAPITVDNYSSISVQVDITGTATVNFEGTQNQSVWVPVACIEVGDTAYASITTTTVTVTVRCNVAGLVKFRARTSGNSGTVTVTATSSPAVMGSGGGGGGGASLTLDQAFDNGKGIDGATSEANCFFVGSATRFFCWYDDATDGLIMKPSPLASTVIRAWTNFNIIFRDVENACDILVIDPDAASSNAAWQFGCTASKPLESFHVALEPRGAATSALESILTNHPKQWYITLTDANTDAGDFAFIVKNSWAGATTATFRLTGVSKHATPSGNIDLDCAMTTVTPGTDTFAAHSTTGEVTALLTPATQNRPVAVTTAAHTINGGPLVAGDIVHGSCEVDATATTSAQMADFRLWATVLVTLSKNSLSD